MTTDAYGMDYYQQYIHKSRYARWDDEKERRENWDETVDRYINWFDDYLRKNYNHKMGKLKPVLRQNILQQKVMPSMRTLMTAGPALDRDHVAGYNCSYIPIDKPTSFDEILYVLMCGTGVGFSVERQYINKLPEIADEFHVSDIVIQVGDSKLGWAKALKELIHLLYGGQIPSWDVSKVRPKGARLKTFGGRASGPEPLVDLFKFTVGLFKNAAGRKLTSVECHDLVCKIADIVVVGGVRRSALISLSNLSDDRMRNAKSGEWYTYNGHRRLANNSVAYTEKPDIGIFMDEWKALYDSKSGERGVFNRVAAKKQAEKYGRRNANFEFGTNPCGEILLRPREFCNLSEVVIRPEDSLDDLKEKVRLATILGTYQSTLTDFKYISKQWKHNCEEERLLGVSLTGCMDHATMNGTNGFDTLAEWLTTLREVALATNREYAKILGIPESTMITCNKPSGTVSQFVNSSSGINRRHSRWYIRTARNDKKDPVSKFLIDSGIPYEEDVMAKGSTYVFSFPIESPKDALFRSEATAIQQLETWYAYKMHWTEHNPSVTINVREHEWMAVGAWVYEHFDDVGGLSFLPQTDHIYKQAPYQEITEKEYVEFKQKMPETLDWSLLSNYEKDDYTTASQELACVGTSCEI